MGVDQSLEGGTPSAWLLPERIGEVFDSQSLLHRLMARVFAPDTLLGADPTGADEGTVEFLVGDPVEPGGGDPAASSARL